MAKKAIHHPGSDDSDALNSYLRQLGCIDVPDAHEQMLLCRQYEEATSRLRQAVFRFGFSAREIIFHLEKAFAGEEDLNELFLPSSFENGKIPLPAFFTSWHREITEKFAELEKLFNSGENCAACRSELSELLQKYSIQSGVAEEFLNIICGYIRMIVPEFDWGNPPDVLKNITADSGQLEFVSGKLLMFPEEFVTELSALNQAAKIHSEFRNRMVEANLRLADILRLDHFRGLCAFWQVPYGEATAINGEWKEAPGNELFETLQNTFGNIPILAEDLGVITKDVTALREKYNLPGMKILQFAFDSQESSSKNFLPHVYEKNYAVYTGTHDNDTVHGWYNAAKDIDKMTADKYLGITDKKNLHFNFIKAAWASTANLAITPMQDLLGKGSDARMNLPGSASGNWQWRFNWKDLKPEHEQFLFEITSLYERL